MSRYLLRLAVFAMVFSAGYGAAVLWAPELKAPHPSHMWRVKEAREQGYREGRASADAYLAERIREITDAAELARMKNCAPSGATGAN